MDYEIERPVFVIGTGRSGITPLMDLIAYHKDFAWPSQYNNRFVQNPKWSFLSRIVDLPLFRSAIKYNRYIPKHLEVYNLYDHLYLGFRRPFRDLTADDATPIVKKKFRKTVYLIMKYHEKKRFITEYSGWSRIDFIREIFPNAQFIHIVRDGRAVANSLTQVKYWLGWEGPHRWRWGMLSPDLEEKLKYYNYSFLALAAIQWKILVNNIWEKGSALSKDNMLTVRNEDRTKNSQETAYKCIEFCGLDKNSKQFNKHLSTVKIVDANIHSFRISPWRDSLSLKQINMINDLIKEELTRYSYL